MTQKKLIVNVEQSETRIAVIEDEKVAELYVERQSKRGMVGNIYIAKVTRVLPGMQSAFVNIGAERSAFLYGGDVVDPNNPQRIIFEEEERERIPIETVLTAGQDILVQVAKEPLGSKGPRVTMIVTLPGRYLVLIPFSEHVGISRRIEDEEERQRLTDLVEALRPKGFGFIVRTAAAGEQEDVFKKDVVFLMGLWDDLEKKRSKRSSPANLYREPNIILKTTRDLYSEDVSEIVVDEPQAYSQLKHFLANVITGSESKLKLHSSAEPIFDTYGIEMDIAKALSKKVWLPSGGYLIIDQTEALTSFDVNTGKFVGSSSVNETILRTNLEAVIEVVSQIRLRNLGGIIIIDFIDMEDLVEREKINNALLEELKKDKARTNIIGMNELGLVQMTRKRTSESLERTLTVECPHCDGRGRVHSVQTETYNLVRDIERFVLQTGQKRVVARVREDILEWFTHEESDLHANLVQKYDLEIVLEPGSLKMEALEESPYEVLGS